MSWQLAEVTKQYNLVTQQLLEADEIIIGLTDDIKDIKVSLLTN